MIYLANSLAALSILSLVVFIGSLFALFVKSARRRAKWLAVGGFVGFFAAGFASLPFFEHAAHEAGYSDYASQMRAEHLVDEAAERKRSEEAERKAAADEAAERERSIQAARKAAADVAYSAMNPTATYTKAGDDIEDESARDQNRVRPQRADACLSSAAFRQAGAILLLDRARRGRTTS